DGSRWIVKVRPTPEPTFFSANPTDGSRWIVKVHPPPPPKGRTLSIHRLPSVGFAPELLRLILKDHTYRISHMAIEFTSKILPDCLCGNTVSPRLRGLYISNLRRGVRTRAGPRSSWTPAVERYWSPPLLTERAARRWLSSAP